MQITRTSMFSGVTREREIDITEEQLARWTFGEYIQNVCPHLSHDDREFLMTGVTPEEWHQTVAERDDYFIADGD